MAKIRDEDKVNEFEERQKKSPQKSALREILDYVIMIAIVVAGVYLLTEFIIINARIPTSSMEETIGVQPGAQDKPEEHLSSTSHF